MEIHIQLAGVELGPYSEKQVRDYLAEGLLSSGDPAKFEGKETWETVSEVLAKLNGPAISKATETEQVPPATIPPQEAVASVPTPVAPAAVRKSSLITSTTPLPRTNRDTIRVPLPQLAKALAKQTTQGAKHNIPQPAPPPAVVPASTPAKPALTSSAPLPAKPSDMARTSLLSAVKILGKKSTQELRPAPVIPGSEGAKGARPATVPVVFAKNTESLRTMPMPMGKSLAKTEETGEKPLPAIPAPAGTKAPELSSNTPKGLDKKQTTLLAKVDALAKKADSDNKPIANVRALSATRSPDISAAPLKLGETKPAPLPTPIKVLPKQNETGASAPPADPRQTTSISAASIPSPKSPQNLRTTPMAMVRALPKQTDPKSNVSSGDSPASSESTAKEGAPAPVSTVRFVPEESTSEAAPSSKAPPVAEQSVFSKKTLRRTTGSLPSLVEALNKKTDEPGTTKSEEPPKLEAAPESSVEPTVDEGPKAQSSPFISWLKSFAGKFKKTKQEESSETTVTEPSPEKGETTDAESKTTGKAEGDAKAPAPARKTIKLVRTTPSEKTSKPNLETPEVIQTAFGPVSKRLPPAQKPLGSIHESTDAVKKSSEKAPETAVDTVKLGKASLEPSPKKSELVTKTLPPVSKKEVPTEKLPEPESKTEAVEEPSAEQADVPSPGMTRARKRLLTAGLVGLLVVGVLVWGGFYYVDESHRAAASLLQALKDGNTVQLTQGIDFPAVRKALTEEAMTQVAKTEGQDSATDVLVSVMIKNSIDYYVTPEAISALVTKSDRMPKPEKGPTLLPQRAAAILNGLNNLPVKSQGLVSPLLYVIDLDAAKLDLQFSGTGWKLERVELKASFQMPQESGAVSIAPTDLGASMVAPVVETYLAEGKAKFEKARWDEAIEAFSQVLAIDPKQTIAYYNRGMAKSNNRDVNGAIADFTQAISLNPKFTEAYYSRGEAKAVQNDVDAAIADYTQAINIDPKMAIAFYKRGTIRTQKSDYEGALADLTQSILLDPNQANSYSNRGFVRQAQHDLDGAIADYTQALAINPKLAQAYYNRGLVRCAKADLEGAIADYNQALDLDPKMSHAYYQRGVAKNTKNDLDGAIADYNQALALDPKLAPALSDRAVAKQAKGDLKSALLDFNAALALDPKNADAYYGRGLIKEQLNDLDGSLADSSRALDLDPKRSQAYYNRGFAKLVKGNLEGARTDLQKFCELEPRNPFADSARLYLWLIEMAQNPNGTANQELSDALQNNWSRTSDDLITQIAAFLLDRKTETDLIAAAASPDAKKDAGQHCEIWYFIGMKRLLAGDKASAIDYFRKCLATGQKDYCEYILAQAELQVLAPTP